MDEAQTQTASQYSSRKLLALLDEVHAADLPLSEHIREQIVNELTRRGHYLTELSDRGLMPAYSAA